MRTSRAPKRSGIALLFLFTLCSLTVSEATFFQSACKQPVRCYAGLGVQLLLRGPGKCREVCSIFPTFRMGIFGYQCGSCAAVEEPLSFPTAEPSGFVCPESSTSFAPHFHKKFTTNSSRNLPPSTQPSGSPSDSSDEPSNRPTLRPSTSPSQSPSVPPSVQPTGQPSTAPSVGPSRSPSAMPSSLPSPRPSAIPTLAPTQSPSSSPTVAPTQTPSAIPSSSPTAAPTPVPSPAPSPVPIPAPSPAPPTVPKFPTNWNENPDPKKYPIPVAEAQGAMIGIDFVIISGFTKGFGQATPQVYAKDGTVPEANWRRMDDMPVSEGITHAAFFVLGSKFYMCGGYLGGHPGLHIPTCLIYDHSVAPGSGQWDRSDSFPDLPEGRAGGGMVYDSVTNVAVFAGGAIRPTAGNAHAEDRRDAWKIDLGNMSAGWQRVTEIPFKSNHMSFVTAKDGTGAEHHFFVGGQVGENEITGNVDDNYEYNVAADTWIQHPNMPFTRGHAASSTRAYGNGYIVVAGSTNEYGKTSDISYYDIPSQSWTKNIGKLPNALNTPVCAISPVNMNGVQFYHCESGKPTEKFSYFREISL